MVICQPNVVPWKKLVFFICHLECLMLKKKKRNLTVFTKSACEEMRQGWDGPKVGGKGLVHSECSHCVINMKHCFTWSS